MSVETQIQTGQVCNCLRSKEMFTHDEPGWDIRQSSSGIFWCLHTQNCLGPDGQIANPDNCQAGRSCHRIE
ncbi:MAG TPA: hypothetical protein VMT20_23010 [Terriglobia bacterium]|nr:hypothetical protein [Terriglobia bacterium]